MPDFDQLIHEDRVHRDIYTDETIFKDEMRKIFGAVWVYLAHESQLPNIDDFFMSKLGLRPIIVTRDSSGKIRALYNRCTHRGTTICRKESGSAKAFACPYHGWTFLNSGKLKGVPWPEGYADDFSDTKFNLAQVPRVQSYRGFIFGTLNTDALSLENYLGAACGPIDQWLDRHPGGKVAISNANRLKFHGNWKLAYDNSADGYHVVFSHRSLLSMENRLLTEDEKGMSYYKDKPDEAPMYVQYLGNGHHFKDKRPNIENRPGALWKVEGPHPGMEGYEADLRARLGDKADRVLDIAASEPVNINIFPNLLILGNHIQVLQPISIAETNTTWYGTAVIDDDNELEGTVDDVNAIRMRTQEGFPNFGEVDDLMNFEQIQQGLTAEEDEWIYMHRGLGIDGRISIDKNGIITAPATDEVFMREYMKEYKRLMMDEPNLTIQRRIE
ncbi:MAG: aromatic ring-hydroxylating oxygenase subunit alpha [Rhodospirillales bacterium]|jgi:phenylpropionate dioxygenase-like ring-hydroxylating dioxygenase large terminal subunit